jgi:site-specific DNA recombinase
MGSATARDFLTLSGGSTAPRSSHTLVVVESAALYLRISEDRAGLGLGVARQEHDIRAVAETRGYAVAGIYNDNDRSAWSGKHRPEWERLLADAADGRFTVLIAWHDDRLWRNVIEQQLVFEMLGERGVTKIIAGGRDYSTASIDDNVLSGIQALFAQKESADKSRRIRRKVLEKAQKGELHCRTNYRPFGFEEDYLTIHEPEAAHLRDAVTRVLRGEPVGRITRSWNRQGVRTVAGGAWWPETLFRILRSGRICGWRSHHGELVAEAVWPGIIDRQTWDKLQAALAGASRPRSTRASYLLAGLAICGRCGRRLTGNIRSDGQSDYRCSPRADEASCGRVSRRARLLDTYVTEEVFAALDTPKLIAAIRAQAKGDCPEAHLLQTLRDDQEAIEQLAADHYVARLIERGEFLAARQGLQSRIDDTKRALATIDRGTLIADLPTGGEAVRAAWGERGVDWQRALLRTVLEKVVVHPAVRGHNFFDPTKIEIVWRG